MRARTDLRVRFLFPVAAAAWFACSSAAPSSAPSGLSVASVKVNPESYELVYVGETKGLVARAFDAEGFLVPDQVFTWTASDSNVVSVSSVGRVTAKARGTAKVTATAVGASGASLLTMNPDHASTRCVGCHVGSPGHLATAFPGASCPACHLGALDNLSGPHDFPAKGHSAASSGFDLIGIHDTLPCVECHDLSTGAPRFATADAYQCIGCHRTQYEARHAGFGFPTSCLSCHTVYTFQRPQFDHTAASGGFSLLGAHTQLACTECHDAATGAPLYTPASQSDCIACHRADYTVQHGATSGWPTTCTLCHTTATFTGAVFDHTAASGGFTLLGAHTQLACTKCHDAATGAPLYTPATQNDCIACHRADYTRQHGASSGWPTTCADCHTTATFAGAVFDHDRQFFPIYHGEHAGKWSSCQTCHVNPENYSTVSCAACHRGHGRGDVNDAGTCMACHRSP